MYMGKDYQARGDNPLKTQKSSRWQQYPSLCSHDCGSSCQSKRSMYNPRKSSVSLKIFDRSSKAKHKKRCRSRKDRNTKSSPVYVCVVPNRKITRMINGKSAAARLKPTVNTYHNTNASSRPGHQRKKLVVKSPRQECFDDDAILTDDVESLCELMSSLSTEPVNSSYPSLPNYNSLATTSTEATDAHNGESLTTLSALDTM